MEYDVKRMDIDEKFLHLFSGTWFTKEMTNNYYYSYAVYNEYTTLRSTDISDFFPITKSESFDFEYRYGRYHGGPPNFGGHNVSFELFYELIDDFNKWR